MKSFWSYISDAEHSVGCTGGIAYVYDGEGKEIAKFRDLSYAYLPLISPDGSMLAIKSTAGRLAVYSLRELRLLKKFRFVPVDGCQDGNMCFSPDGALLYNLEDTTGAGDIRIAVYSTADFAPVAWLREIRKSSRSRLNTAVPCLCSPAKETTHAAYCATILPLCSKRIPRMMSGPFLKQMRIFAEDLSA